MSTIGFRSRIVVVCVLAAMCLAPVAPAQAPAAKTGDTDPVRAAQEVFQDPAFWWKRTEKVDVALPWYQTLWNAIVDFIVRVVKTALKWLWQHIILPILKFFFGVFGIETGDWSSGTKLIWLAAAVLLLWAAWKAYPLISRWLGRTSPLVGHKEAMAFSELPEAGLLFEQASTACREGRYADSIRLTLLSLIARLQQEGLLRYDASRTNREYQTELRPRPKLASLFGEVARPFERVWYGRLPAIPTEAERVLETCRPIVMGEATAS
jgi:hypothetical protein